MVREEEGSLAAEDVVHPLRTLAQQAYSQDMTSHAANQAGHADQQRSVAQAAACGASQSLEPAAVDSWGWPSLYGVQCAAQDAAVHQV